VYCYPHALKEIVLFFLTQKSGHSLYSGFYDRLPLRIIPQLDSFSTILYPLIHIPLTDMPALLEARNLVRQHPFGQRQLLKNVSLTLQGGDRVAVAGPSGAGKTLLLRALALLDGIDSGQVLWRGHPIPNQQVPDFRRHAIYFHQRPSILADTVEAALRQPLALTIHRGRKFDKPWIVERLASFDRDEKFLEQKVANLSGGELQITALLRALQLEPNVLLLDEPASALDPKTAAAAEQWLTAWIDQSPGDRAMIWVTHDANQANRVANRMLHMENGHL
jgi:UDP-glucose/iron transport system ATP-binding protein